MEPRKAILMLMYATAQADGNMSNDELNVAKKNGAFYLGYNLQETEDILHEYLSDIGRGSYNSITAELVKHIPGIMHIGALEMMFEVANIDLNQDITEDMFIETVLRQMKIIPATALLISQVVFSKNCIIRL